MSHLLLIMGALVTTVLSACSQHSINEFASTILLKPQTQMTRQRVLSISHLSHVGLYIDSQRVSQNTDNAINPLLKPRLQSLSQGAQQAVASHFAEYSYMDKPSSLNGNIDFVIEAQIMEMTLTEKKAPVTVDVANKAHTPDTDDEPPRIEIPIDYLKMKLVLKDARSQQLIDVAYLQSRSGQLEYTKGYAVFAEYSMKEYLKAITQ